MIVIDSISRLRRANIIYCLMMVLVFGVSRSFAEVGRPLIGGEPIPVGTLDRTGILSLGIPSIPVGIASVTGAKEPDLFVSAGQHSVNPGVYLYRNLGRSKDGAPLFGERIQIKAEGLDWPRPTGSLSIFQVSDGEIYAFWLSGSALQRAMLNRQTMSFVKIPEGDLPLQGVLRRPRWLGVASGKDGAIDLWLGIDNGVKLRPTDVSSWRSPDYRPFDGAGVYRGGWPFVSIYGARITSPDTTEAATAIRISQSNRETLLNYGGITPVDLGPGRDRDAITGSWFSNLLYYHRHSSTSLKTEANRLLADSRGIAHRNPFLNPVPVAYPNPDSARKSDLIVGGECGLYYYRFTGQFTSQGAPIYDDPIPALERDAMLYPGSLPVVNAVDWNGDGVLDLISGNSEGRVFYFHNAGSNEMPAFAPGVAVLAGGREIHIHPGYSDVQGPQEANWGYSSPNIADWNGDGLPDIMMSSATARHEVYLNRGTPTEPKFERPETLYCWGLDLHGTWRVRPGVAQLNGRMAYVMLDDDDEFHLYWRIDDFNVSDGGKLRLEDGSAIRANYLAAGATGRSKILLTDWDQDGRKDLLVGTPRHSSIPNPETGLPKATGLKGAAVVFLRNVGTDSAPRFAFPTLLRFRGEPIYLGQHACSPTVWDTGQAKGPDLIVGDQEGRLIYYNREDLSWPAVSD